MRQGGVHVHGFLALDNLLFRGLVLHGAHIVQPVSNLDQHHPDVLAHGHEHLAQIFHLSFLGGGEIGSCQFGNALHQLRHGGSEQLFNLIVGGIGVLNTVMEQGTQNGINVQPHFYHDFRNRQGVDDVGGAVLALLVLVLLIGILDGLVD